MRKPEFIVLGAGKCGTTSLYQYLRQHPQIFLPPIKETYFFAIEGETHPVGICDAESYFQMYEQAPEHSRTGEVSSIYLYNYKAADRIKCYVPEAKLIAILRNPIDRAFSDYQFHCRENHQSVIDPNTGRWRSFEEQISHSDYFIQLGFYYGQLIKYFEKFDRDQIRVYFFDDLCADSTSVVREMLNFIGVDASQELNLTKKFNVSGKPKSLLLHDFLHNETTFPHSAGPAMSALWSGIKAAVPKGFRLRIRATLHRRNLQRGAVLPETRVRLTEVYREDVTKLSQLLDRDLSAWLSPGNHSDG